MTSLSFYFFFSVAQASVTGPCSNCHTMHNSEAGSSVVATPQAKLTNDTCVGCHSNDTDQTIVTFNGSRIPIVFNTVPPTTPLAGGNFYWVSQGAASDEYGHNVWGISGVDHLISVAPGNSFGCDTGGCHKSLAEDPALNPFKYEGTNGCEGCHQSTKHHGTDPALGSPETEASGWYRFLHGHTDEEPDRSVAGIEDPDWEHTPTKTNHNIYSGYTEFYSLGPSGLLGLSLTHSITAFCRGCHTAFHTAMGPRPPNFLMQSPWLRHPTDLALPTTGEYAAYNPVTDYNPQVPVAWKTLSSPASGTAVVMCLSCHRAHGSQYPDMLRWDYTTMDVGTTTNANTGCFVCHSSKDGL